MKLNLVCPSCNAELEVEDIAPGTMIECPGCHHALTVPAAPTAKLAGQKKQLRLPSRTSSAAPSSAPVYIPVPAKPRGIIGGAFHGCGVLFVMLLILIAVIVGCNLVVLGGAAAALSGASAWKIDEKTPSLANRGTGGELMITGQGPTAVTVLVSDLSVATFSEMKSWTGTLVVDGRETRRDRWIGATGLMMHLDTTADARLAADFLGDLLAAGENATAELRFPLSTGGEGSVRIRLRGLREAATKVGYLTP